MTTENIKREDLSDCRVNLYIGAHGTMSTVLTTVPWNPPPPREWR